jgi:hypothetical protein
LGGGSGRAYGQEERDSGDVSGRRRPRGYLKRFAPLLQTPPEGRGRYLGVSQAKFLWVANSGDLNATAQHSVTAGARCFHGSGGSYPSEASGGCRLGHAHTLAKVGPGRGCRGVCLCVWLR